MLARLEAELRAKAIPFIETMAPGLTDAEIDEIIEPAHLIMPEEVRAWWRWHNGPGPDAPRDAGWLLPYRDARSLKACVDLYLYVGRDDRLIEPLGELPVIYVECRGSGDVPAPIYSQNDYAGDDPRQVLPSYGELVLTWIDYLERGVYATKPEGGGWHDIQDYPPEVLRLGVR